MCNCHEIKITTNRSVLLGAEYDMLLWN